MISLVTIIEFFESLFASIRRKNAENAADEAVKTAKLEAEGVKAGEAIDAELAKASGR